MRGRDHPARQPESQRRRRNQPRGEGDRGARTGVERGEVGPWPDLRRALQSRRAHRLAGVASRSGAAHARQSRWAHARGGGLLRQSAATVSRAEADPGRGDSKTQRGGGEEGARRPAVDRGRALGGVAPPARDAADDQHRGVGGGLHGCRAARRSCRIAV